MNGKRKKLILSGTVLFLFVVVVALSMRTSPPETLSGPIAIVEGPVPKHGFLGVDFGREPDGPLIVESVLVGSNAAEAGIQPGDVIVAVGERRLDNRRDLVSLIEATAPGDVVPITISRSGREVQVSIKLLGFKELVTLREQQGVTGPTHSASPGPIQM